MEKFTGILQQSLVRMNRKLLAGIFALLLVGSAAATITSVDRLDFDSNAGFFQGETFVFEITSNRDTDKIDLTLDNNLREAVSDGEVQNSVTVEATQQRSELKYGFRDTGDVPVTQFEPNKFQTDISALDNPEVMNQKIRNNGVQSRCFDITRDGAVQRGEDYFIKSGFDGFNAVAFTYCVKPGMKYGEVGEIESDPAKIYKTQFTVTDASGTHTKTLTNGEGGAGNTARFGSNTLLDFTGSYSASSSAASPTDEKILHSNQNSYINPLTGETVVTQEGGFTVIDDDRYSTYKNDIPRMTSKLESWRGGLFDGDSESVVENVNDLAAEAAAPHTSSEFTSAEFEGDSFGDGAAVLNVPNLIYPTFTGYAKACRYTGNQECDAAVQIRKTIGQAEITNIEGTSITELETGYIDLSFKNIGGSEGSFSTRVRSCDTGFSSTGGSREVNLDSGESTNMELPVSFSSTSSENKEITGSCEVEVTNGLGDSITESVQITGQQVNECTPGERFRKVVDGRYGVYECGDDGLEYNKVLQCTENEVAQKVDGEYQCLGEEDPPVVEECDVSVPFTDQTFKDPICEFQNQAFFSFGNIMLVFDVLVAGVAGIYSMGIANSKLAPIVARVFGGVNIPVSKKGIGLGVSLLAFAGAAFVTYGLVSSILVKILAIVVIGTLLYLRVGIDAAVPG